MTSETSGGSRGCGFRINAAVARDSGRGGACPNLECRGGVGWGRQKHSSRAVTETFWGSQPDPEDWLSTFYRSRAAQRATALPFSFSHGRDPMNDHKSDSPRGWRSTGPGGRGGRFPSASPTGLPRCPCGQSPAWTGEKSWSAPRGPRSLSSSSVNTLWDFFFYL